jgi:hypothetical protein
VAAIHLGPASPPASCGPPGDSAGPASTAALAAAGASPTRPCSGWGLPSRPVTRPLVRSYRTVSPLPPCSRGAAVCSLWHCPAGRPDWRLASTLPCGGRTFLDPGPTRDRGRPAGSPCQASMPPQLGPAGLRAARRMQLSVIERMYKHLGMRLAYRRPASAARTTEDGCPPDVRGPRRLGRARVCV